MTAGVDFALHLVQRLGDRLDLLLLAGLGGERCALSLDDIARAQQFERPGGGLRFAACMLGRRLHVDSGTDAHLDPPFDFERDQRLAHRGPRHAQLLREVAFGRQPRTGGKLARGNQLPYLIGDLPIQPARFDALERHGVAGENPGRYYEESEPAESAVAPGGAIR